MDSLVEIASASISLVFLFVNDIVKTFLENNVEKEKQAQRNCFIKLLKHNCFNIVSKARTHKPQALQQSSVIFFQK